MDKPWIKDKRSWIFYSDEMQKDTNAIWGETEKTVYLFDYETAKILIWIKEWSTFTEFGVTNLIKKFNEDWDVNSDFVQGTRILYKGIELKNRYMNKDSELLEYIDIKYTLDRKYIDIDRKNFSSDGLKYFESKIYPSVINSIKEVLKNIEKNVKRNSRKGGFCAKIEKTLNELIKDWECKREIQSEIEYKIIELVSSLAVLAYFATRDYWDIWSEFGLQKNSMARESIWQTVLKKVDYIIKDLKINRNRKLLDHLKQSSVLFRINTLSEDLNLAYEKGKGISCTYFYEIFLDKNHWAILQTRKDKYNPWRLQLIKIENNKTEYEQICTIPKNSEENLENWGEKLCNYSKSFLDTESYEHQLLLRWMLKCLPTIGIFCDENGNTRVNVLGSKIAPSIYMNLNFKTLLVNRIINEVSENSIERFCITTWQNREYISFRELPFKIFFINEGTISTQSACKCVIPLTGKWFRFWKTEVKSKANKSKKTNLKKLIKNMDVMECITKKMINFAFEHVLKILGDSGKRYEIISYRENILKDDNELKNLLLRTAMVLFDGINDFCHSQPYIDINLVEQLLTQEHLNWSKIYYIVVKITILAKVGDDTVYESIRELQHREDFKKLSSVWYFLCFERKRIVESISITESSYRKFVVQNPDYVQNKKRILDYIEKNSIYKGSIEKIDEQLKMYEREIIDILKTIETSGIENELAQLLRKYSFFTESIEKR